MLRKFILCIALLATRLAPCDEWTYSLALQAATYGAPLVTMYALRDNIALGPHPKAPPNSLWRMEDISTPELSKEAGYVTPNVNVIYGFGFLDLRAGPVVIDAPPAEGRYYMIEIVDMWTNAFAYIGGKKTQTLREKFLLTGPNWKGKTPPGMQRIACPTPWVLIQPRVHIYSNGKIDLSGAKNILNGIHITAPSVGTYDYPAPQPINPNLPVSALQYKDPLQFWEILSIALNENPPPKDQVEALLPLFKPLGIELGKPWDRSKATPEMIKAAQNIGSILAHLSIGTLYNGAEIPPPTIGNFGTDYKTRAVIARVGLTANQPSEAIYWMYSRDKNEKFLTGKKKYTLTLKEPIPFETPGFWSITLYDSNNNYTIKNPINRYMLGSDTPELKKNPDGSITIYIQATTPGKEKESNWLPSPPGLFYLTPRSYPPKPVLIQMLSDVSAYPIPAIEEVP